jgi:hypothetical protein
LSLCLWRLLRPFVKDLAAVASALALLAVLTLMTPLYSAFSGTTSNLTNSMAAARVSLGSNDTSPSTPLLTMSDGKPSDSSVVGCLAVTYTGDIPATVRMYAVLSGTGLGSYLNLTLERGTMNVNSVPSCTGFAPDGATYAAASGVMYTGTVGAFATAYGSAGTALLDPTAAAPTTWTNGTTAAYRFTVSVQNSIAAQGLTCQATVWWEATNI